MDSVSDSDLEQTIIDNIYEQIGDDYNKEYKNVLNTQCLNRRIGGIDEVREEVEAWGNHRNNKCAKINWRFTTKESRIKLKRLYPSIED